MDSLSVVWMLHCLVLVLALLSQVVGRGVGERKKQRPQPRFLESQVNYTYKEGELARLECILEGLGTKNVIWRRSSDPNPLTIGKKRYVDDTRVMVEHTPLGKDWHLLIRQVRLDDEGQYECQVASMDKALRRYVNLIVKPGDKVPTGTPEIHIEGDTYVEKNSVIRLVCNATGEEHPPDDIDWFLNGQKLLSDFAYQISIEKRMSLTEKTIYSILEIKNANMKDAGIYVCRTSDLQIASARVDVLNDKTGQWHDGNYNDQTSHSRTNNTNLFFADFGMQQISV
ncbi:opioid-binding protein/cell adhesion molecule-like isoform X2 [Littorina saxatilis]|uniref:opioid-binding protein/cell adhesion molecule-like isoform X2 n=1 Tax=Littorina saxatilis TaxID=31220 RepID=UPI0038B53323